MKRNFMCFPGFKKKAITFSYDDGVRSDKKIIKIFQDNGLKGTFNINTGLFAKKNNNNDIDRMTLNEVIDTYKNSGMEVAIHGYKHLLWDGIDSSILLKDIILDRINLEKIFSTFILGCAYPYGCVNENIENALKACGIKYSRTVESTSKFDLPQNWFRWNPTSHHANPELMNLAKEFINQDIIGWRYYPTVFYLWGHSYEYVYANNWSVIENFSKFIANREDVWYATNGEIYNYVSSFDNLIWGINEDYVFNPTANDIYINYYGKEILIKIGEKVSL